MRPFGRTTLCPGIHSAPDIRHLALDARGEVWFGCQYEGDPTETPPFVGRHRRGAEIELFPGPAEMLRRLRNYVGSLAVDTSGDILATSLPQGGLVVFWDTLNGRYLGSRELADGCGVAPAAEGLFLETSGRGAIVEASPVATRTIRPEGAGLGQPSATRRRVTSVSAGYATHQIRLTNQTIQIAGAR